MDASARQFSAKYGNLNVFGFPLADITSDQKTRVKSIMGALFPHLAVVDDSTALTSAIIFGNLMEELTTGKAPSDSFALDNQAFVSMATDLVKDEAEEE